jgi:hypothetical protein
MGEVLTPAHGPRLRACVTSRLSTPNSGCCWRFDPATNVDAMPAVGELVCRSGQWMVQPPEVCPRGHRLLPGRMLVGTVACSCGRHITWQCECGEVTYGPALTPSCSVLDGPARIRSY